MEHNETTSGGLLDKQHIIAQAGFNRWLVPPAALAIHLCIGMAYGFSVFWLPLSQSIGITKAVACPADTGLLQILFTTTCDWKVADLGWMYTPYFLSCSALAPPSGAVGSNGSVRAKRALFLPYAGVAACSFPLPAFTGINYGCCGSARV